MPRGGARPGAGRKPSPEKVAIVDMAKGYGPEMLGILASIARNTKAPAAARASAAEGILSRAYGRPAQALAISQGEVPAELIQSIDLSLLSPDQLAAYEQIALHAEGNVADANNGDAHEV